MLRPALPLMLALAALSACTDALAGASVANGPTVEMPAPSNEEANGTQASPSTPAVAPNPATPAARPSNKAARQRWKALLPGTLKSVS